MINISTQPIAANARQQSALFVAIENQVNYFLLDSSVPNSVSVFIWGGVAAEILLQTLGRKTIRWSKHDVELCLTNDGLLFDSPSLLLDLEARVLNDPMLRLHIGGTSITSPKAGTSLADFQTIRVNLPDGDLLLNNVVLAHLRERETWCFLIPEPLAIALENRHYRIDMKSSASLSGVDRQARRLARNASKAIRLEIGSALEIESQFIAEMTELARRFRDTVEACTSSKHLHSREIADARQWLEGRQLHTPNAASAWLFCSICSDTLMRLAAALIEQKLDYEQFKTFAAIGHGPFVLLKHHLILELAGALSLNTAEVAELVVSSLQSAYSNYCAYLR